MNWAGHAPALEIAILKAAASMRTDGVDRKKLPVKARKQQWTSVCINANGLPFSQVINGPDSYFGHPPPSNRWSRLQNRRGQQFQAICSEAPSRPWEETSATRSYEHPRLYTGHQRRPPVVAQWIPRRRRVRRADGQDAEPEQYVSQSRAGQGRSVFGSRENRDFACYPAHRKNIPRLAPSRAPGRCHPASVLQRNWGAAPGRRPEQHWRAESGFCPFRGQARYPPDIRRKLEPPSVPHGPYRAQLPVRQYGPASAPILSGSSLLRYQHG